MSKVEERREQITQFLQKLPLATVTDMAEQFHVTTETIRKDLQELQRQGKVVRMHGCAAMSSEDAKVPYSFRERINVHGKVAIAKAAVELIQQNDSILIESSTTAAAMCHELLEKQELLKTLDVITNSFYFANLLQFGKLCARLFFLGGWVRASESATHGFYTAQLMSGLHVDKAFISAAALGEKMVLSSYYEDDMIFQQRAIELADQPILLLEKSKYPTSAMFSVCSASQMKVIITDASIRAGDIADLKKRGVEIVPVE